MRIRVRLISGAAPGNNPPPEIGWITNLKKKPESGSVMGRDLTEATFRFAPIGAPCGVDRSATKMSGQKKYGTEQNRNEVRLENKCKYLYLKEKIFYKKKQKAGKSPNGVRLMRASLFRCTWNKKSLNKTEAKLNSKVNANVCFVEDFIGEKRNKKTGLI